MQAGGFISVGTGSVPDANAIPVAKEKADERWMLQLCIDVEHVKPLGKNGQEKENVIIRVSSLALLPSREIESKRRPRT